MNILIRPILYVTFALVLLCQNCGNNENFSVRSQSPSGRYAVELVGTKKPAGALPGEFYLQQVRLTAFKDQKRVLEDDQFYSEDHYESPFLQAFPLQQWISDSILRLGEDDHQPFRDEIALSNSAQQKINLLIIKYGKYERFLIFDLDPGSKVQLLASPQFNKEWAASEVFYTAYYDDRSFAGSSGGARTRKIEDGPQKLSVDVKEVQNNSKPFRR
jgi:hypothetical protein